MTTLTHPTVRPMRRRAEQLLRLLALGALLTAFWWTWRSPVRAPERAVTPLVVDSGTTVRSLRSLVMDNPDMRSSEEAPHALDVTVHAVPSAAVRAAFGALVLSGWPVTWRDQTAAQGLAVSVARSARPSAPVIIRVAEAASARAIGALVVRDGDGLIDSVPMGPVTRQAVVRATPSVRSWALASVGDTVRVSQGGGTARVVAPSTAPASRVLLLAAPGWESKFVVAALEASGWEVDARLQLSPRAAVTVGAPRPLDLRRYAVAIVLDSMAVDAAALGRFVAVGGGLVLAGDALRLPSLVALRAARPTALRGAIAGALQSEAPRQGLERWLLEPAREAEVLAADTVAPGRSEPTVVALRRQQGRLLAVAYRESWRWRMQGTDAGLEAHRRWWDAVAAAAAGSPSSSATVGVDRWPGEAAPYADLVALAGTPAPEARGVGQPSVPHPTDRRDWPPRLVLLAGLALLGEWGSRRLRGAH